MSIERTDHRYDWIDCARLIAALSVLLYHYIAFAPLKGYYATHGTMADLLPVAVYGYHGVELFFVISGFVIMRSVADRSASAFAAARMVRLYPTYVFCMTATALALVTMGSGPFEISSGKYLANLTMLAPAFGETYVDSVYWTLVKELVFYAAVGLLLLAGLRERLELIARIWLGSIVIARLAGIEALLVGAFFELFAAGCLFYFGWTRGWTGQRIAASAVASALVVHGIVSRGGPIGDALGIALDPVALAGIGLAIVAAFVVFGHLDPHVPFARWLGAPTYPLYLLHDVIGILVIAWLMPLVGAGEAIALTAVAMIGLAFAVVEVVERRPRALWRRLAAIAVRPLAWLESRVPGRQAPLQSPGRSPLKGP